MNRCMDVDMLIRKYIDPDIKKFSNSDVKIVLENLKQNILKAQTIEPCEDAISREAVKEEICKPTWKIANKGELIAMINFIPSVAPSRPQGEWIRDRYWSRGIGMGEEYGFFYKCSLCEYEVENGYTRCGFNFCPYCGARMKGADDE